MTRFSYSIAQSTNGGRYFQPLVRASPPILLCPYSVVCVCVVMCVTSLLVGVGVAGVLVRQPRRERPARLLSVTQTNNKLTPSRAEVTLVQWLYHSYYVEFKASRYFMINVHQ